MVAFFSFLFARECYRYISSLDMTDGVNLLTAIARNGSSITLRLLEDDYFVEERELSIFRMMRSHLRNYGRVPEVSTVEDELRIRLPSVPETVDYYLDRVHKRRVYNGVREQLPSLRNALQEADIPQIIYNTEAIRNICRPMQTGTQDYVSMADMRSTMISEYRRMQMSMYSMGVPSGSEGLNEETGGYHNGDLVILVSRPGIGKSHRIIYDAITAHRAGKSVLFVTMEMTLMQIGFRIASHIANLDPDYVRKGTLPFMWQGQLFDAMEELNSWSSFNLFAGNFNKRTADIEAKIEETCPDIVFIDGLYLATPNSPAAMKANRYEKIAYVLDDLRALTLKSNRPIIGSTQFNRAAGKGGQKDASLETIGYTDTIATHATLILGMKQGVMHDRVIRASRQEYEEYLEGNPVAPIRRIKKMSNYRILEILKGREGEGGTIYTKFMFAPTEFEDTTEEEAMGREPIEAANIDYME